jgi:hypothetical protein
MLKLSSLSQKDAQLIQAGLKALGFYKGTTRGKPGPKTNAAYKKFMAPRNIDPSFSEALALAAESQVGQREEGNNGGAAVRKYQNATWLEPGAWPWCAAFVCWSFKEALKKSVQPIQRPRTAGAWDFENWAKKEGAELIKPASDTLVKRGDILVYTFSHIGIAAMDELEGEVETIEGNTNHGGDREGDGVYRKTRKKSQIRSIIRI